MTFYQAHIIICMVLFCLAACDTEQKPRTSGPAAEHQPTYNTNGSYDDNGAEPPPNNANQNFGFGRGR